MSDWRRRLKEAREREGYSVRKLAEALKKEGMEVSGSSVHQYETGGSTPRPAYLVAFCQITETNPTWLLTGHPPERWTEEERHDRRRMVANYLREIADVLEEEDMDLSDLFPEATPLRIEEEGDDYANGTEGAG